jgi:hypothetical protein
MDGFRLHSVRRIPMSSRDAVLLGMFFGATLEGLTICFFYLFGGEFQQEKSTGRKENDYDS